MNPSISESDYSIDQTTRVERRIAHGQYALTHGGNDVGEEVWVIFALRNGMFRCLTEVDQEWPVPHHRRAQLDMDGHWNPRALWAQVDLNSTRTMGTYLATEGALDIEITSARLHEEEHAGRSHVMHNSPGASRFVNAELTRDSASSNNANLGAQIVWHNEIPFQPGTYLDYASALFNFVMLQHLRLAPGGHADFDSVVLTLPSLEPLRVQQTYARQEDETIILGSDQVPTQRYAITETASPNLLTTFWTDAHGIVLRQELALEGLPYRCEVLSYNWLG